jgi:MFS family permease
VRLSWGSFGALKERPFRLLWLGQTASAIGDSLIPVALAFAALEVDGSASGLGLVLASLSVSRVAWTLVAGVWADRLPRRVVMIAADWVRAGVQAVVSFALVTGVAELWMLVITSVLFGTASAFFGPATTGLVREIVSSDRLQQANALTSLSRSSVQIFGPALSGVLVAAFSPGWVFAVDAASFVASAGFLLAIRVPATSRPARRRFLADLAEGWHEVASRPWLRASLVAFAVTNFPLAAFPVLGPVVAKEELGGAGDWGVVLTGGAVGAVVGSAIALRLRPERPLLWVFGGTIPVAFMVGSLAPPLPTPAIAVATAIGWGTIAISTTAWQTALQQHVPEHVLSRVSSYDWMVSMVFLPLGFAVAGSVADAAGLAATLWGAAAVFLAGNVVVLALPSVRTLRRADAEPEISTG